MPQLPRPGALPSPMPKQLLLLQVEELLPMIMTTKQKLLLQLLSSEVFPAFVEPIVVAVVVVDHRR